MRRALGGREELQAEWEHTAVVLREAAKLFGVFSGQRKEDKETWWWDEEVQKSIQRKK